MTHSGEPGWHTPIMTDLLDQAVHEETEQSKSARSPRIEVATNRKGQWAKKVDGITVGWMEPLKRLDRCRDWTLPTFYHQNGGFLAVDNSY